jgi:hypothetical protein
MRATEDHRVTAVALMVGLHGLGALGGPHSSTVSKESAQAATIRQIINADGTANVVPSVFIRVHLWFPFFL